MQAKGSYMSYIELDKTRCKSCYLCVDACPKKLIKVGTEIGKTGEYVVEFDDKNNECLGCKMCAITCPDLAITGVFKDE